MIRKEHTLVVTFAVCVLALAALGSPQKAVERPVKLDGHITLTVNMSTGAFVMMDWGEATHAGRFENRGSGYMDLRTGVLIESGGTFTAANGDQIFWVEPVSREIVATGGTGRFEGITGGFDLTPTSDVVRTIHPDTNSLVITFTYEGVGTLTY